MALVYPVCPPLLYECIQVLRGYPPLLAHSYRSQVTFPNKPRDGAAMDLEYVCHLLRSIECSHLYLSIPYVTRSYPFCNSTLVLFRRRRRIVGMFSLISKARCDYACPQKHAGETL